MVSIHSSLPVTRPTGGTCPTEGSADWTSTSTLDCKDQFETGSGSGNCTRIEQLAAAAGTYYIRVFGYNNASTGAYGVSFTVR
jgi:hypothetical protein